MGLRNSPDFALATRAPSVALQEVRDLFRVLDTYNIRYCHWKSNEHLEASLRGLTDLDVLVDRSAAPALARALAGTSFRQMTSLPHRGYPGVQSYLGMDLDSGTLLHFHLHYQLTIGERHLKSYHLPWEELTLSTRVLDAASGAYISDPHLEFVLLMVRAGLKVRLRERMRVLLGRDHLSDSLRREAQWLTERLDHDRLAALSRQLLGERAAVMVVGMATGARITMRTLQALCECAEPPLAAFRTYGASAARLRRWSRESRQRIGGRLRQAGFLTPSRRLVPQGGIIVAFVGVDGSGKSTIAADIREWLAPLLDVVPMYLGSGSGPKSGVRRLLEFSAAGIRRARKEFPVERSAGPRRGRGTSMLRTVGEILWMSALSRERRRKAAKARRAQNLGMIVICDRFPQSQLEGNDGPQLAHWLQHRSSICRFVARQELRALRLVEGLAPDLVVKLDIPPEVSMRRKPETPPALVHSKIRALQRLKELELASMVEVDATRPYGEVLLDVKRLVWGLLGHG